MKYYYNDKLVRTSDRTYTHAVINMETGECLSCRANKAGAEQEISSRIARERTGIENCSSAIKALNRGLNYYFPKIGRRSYRERLHSEDTIEYFEKWIRTYNERIERIQNTLIVVELEAR